MGENLVAGLLKNIENLATIQVKQLGVLTNVNRKTNNILSNVIVKELQAQKVAVESLSTNIGNKLDTLINDDKLLSVLNDIKGLQSKSLAKPTMSLFGGPMSVTKGLGKFLLTKNMGERIDSIATALDKFVNVVNRLDEDKMKLVLEMFDLGKKILAFSAAVALAAPFLLIASVTTLPLLYAWVMFFRFAAKENKNITRGGATLLYIGVTTFAVVAGFVLASMMLKSISLEGVLLVSLTLLFVAGVYLLISNFSKGAKDGAKTMLWLALTTGIIIGIIALTSMIIDKISWESVLLVGAVLIGVAVAYLIISIFGDKAQKGAYSMIFLAIATALILGIIYAAMELLKEDMAKFKESALLIGKIILATAIAYTVIGLLANTIKEGAFAMILVGVSIGIIVYSLKVFKDAKIGWEDIAILSAFIVGAGAAFALAGGVGFPFIMAGGIAMLVVASSILVFTKALETFSKADWSQEKTTLLTTTITSVVDSLITAFSAISLSEFASLFAGVNLLTNLGNALSAFAQGLSGFATMDLTEVENQGTEENPNWVVTKKGTIDPASVANGIKVMIDAVKVPLEKFGAANGESNFFRDGPIKTGIMLLGNLGKSLSNFAQGIAGFANMTFVEYDEVKNPDGSTSLVKREGSEGTIDPGAISNGIQSMISATTKSIEELGGKGGGWFSSSDYEKGLDMLEQLGDPIYKLAQSAETLTKVKVDPKKLKNTISSTIGAFIGVFSGTQFENIDEDKAEDVVDIFGNFAENISKIPSDGAKNTGEMFVKMKDSINGMDLKKLNKLNDLAYNLMKFAEEMSGSFGNLEDVLKRLKEVVAEMNGINVNTSGSGNTSNNEVRMDLQPIVEELITINDTLNAGLDVEVKNTDMLSAG